MNKIGIDEFYAVHKAEGLKINPETARVHWGWGEVLDPYGVNKVPAEDRCIGRDYFACDPNSSIWVCFGDLPKQTVEILWERLKRDEDSVVDSWVGPDLDYPHRGSRALRIFFLAQLVSKEPDSASISRAGWHE